MNLRIAAFCLALAVATVPASAAQLGGMGAAIHGNGFNFAKANLEKTPVRQITVGKLAVTLQRTKLKDVQKAFGGTLQTSGQGGARADWLCYGADGNNVWFISNALGGYEFVMMVAAETGLLVHQMDLRTRVRAMEAARDRQPNDATANDTYFHGSIR